MTASFISVLLFGFLLGIKHAMEPDHVIAVSAIASESKNIKTFAGVFWGIGHTSTLLIVGMFLILAKNTITEITAMSLEFLVGIMLVTLGIANLHSIHRHNHSHPQPSALPDRITINPQHMKSFCIGFLHGLAGSAAMVLLTMNTVSSVWQGALYILTIGFGTVIGMLSFSTVIGIPFVLSSGKHLNKTLNQITGTISILFGIYYMYDLGVNEGLFSLWFS
ncbi:urease accessory protein UreH domain-containing protein [Neobacillus dielmonensis]|uniref:urease accessory protein UreH domain-containing protein n=1 Tax=Neobacillus dielmonensis TaxID=1347369 RepID=UPI0005A72224|nr:sulfite exporter TauE/SafE family protein [Neobacillus dielmonensis]